MYLRRSERTSTGSIPRGASESLDVLLTIGLVSVDDQLKFQQLFLEKRLCQFSFLIYRALGNLLNRNSLAMQTTNYCLVWFAKCSELEKLLLDYALPVRKSCQLSASYFEYLESW